MHHVVCVFPQIRISIRTVTNLPHTHVFVDHIQNSVVCAYVIQCQQHKFTQIFMSTGWAPHAFFAGIEDGRGSKDAVASKSTNGVVDLEGGGKIYC